MNKIELEHALKKNQFEAYKTANDQAMQKELITNVGNSKIKWNIVSDKGEKTAIPAFVGDHVIVSTVNRVEQEVKKIQPKVDPAYKIDLPAKVEQLKNSYINNYIKARSHNYIVAKFSELKVAFLGQMLSLMGVSISELQKMQKKALSNSVEENILMFEENEYNGEMIQIIGGSPKRVKNDLKVIEEIRTQLMTQMDRLGKPNYYTQQRLVEVKIDACKRILEEFTNELNYLQYQLDYLEIS